MNLQHLETLIPVSAAVQHGCDRIDAVAWGRSDDKLAVGKSDRIIYLYDEKGGLRDKFQTRAKDPSDNTAQPYLVTCMAFSPDSTRLAIGQSDLIVYVYKIGEEFKMKKSIIHKFQQPSSVTSIAWPKENEIFCGLLDGKIRQCHTVSRKGPKTRTVLSNESCNIALISNVWGTEMVASFTDGKIAVFEVGDDDVVSMIAVIKHSCPPTALALMNDAVLAGGYDKKLTIYDKRNGEVKQLFDYSLDNEDREFASAAANPEGKSVVVGSYNKLFVYHYVPRKKEWQEGNAQDFDSLYMVSTVQWKRDGSALAVANNIGAMYLMEAVYKRTRHERFEMIYSSPSSIIMNIFDPQKSIQVKSRYASEILEAKLSKDGNFAIVKTGDTLILCEVVTNLSSEIPWLYNEKGRERFYFEYENVAVIYYESELTVVEYGRDETLGSFRVDTMNTLVLSIRVSKKNVGVNNGESSGNKKLAYLVDPRTITVVDMQYNLTVGNVAHDMKIDWLELNESGSKLLFRDKRSRLYLYGVDSSNKLPLVMTCEFVQWVPGCDVVVAQTNGLLRVWYNLETPDVTVDHEVTGNAIEVFKKSERDPTVVTFEDGSSTYELTLDEGRIQFATALESGNLFQAVWHLDNYKMSPEVLTMWQRLAQVALENYEMRIAQKAYSVLGDVPRAKFLFNTIEMIRGPGQQPDQWYAPGYWKEHQMCVARRNILMGRIKEAEVVFIRHLDIDNALSMYKILQRWEEAITLAKVKNHPQLSELLTEFTQMVYQERDWYEAGKFFESVNLFNHAIFHYLESGFPTHAARCVSKSKMKLDADLLERLGSTLVDMKFYETAGDFFKTTGQRGRSLDSYRKGRNYDKALRLAKRYYPNEVTNIEEEWGDWKFSLRDIDSAGYHYIEAGNLYKAVECALESRQWKKAAQIVSGMKDDGNIINYWMRLGDCYASEGDYTEAENCYKKAEAPKKAIDMYAANEKWDDAVRVANNANYSREEMRKDYIQYAVQFIEQEKYPQAEKLLIAMDEIDQCIGMYAKAKMYDQVLRIVKQHHPSHLEKTATHVAELFLKENDIKSAVSTFLACGLWQNVAALYQERGLFADAHQIASQYGGSKAATYVVFTWAATLQPDAAVKLLNKYNCFDEAITYYNNHGSVELSAELCRLGSHEKLQEILYQMAMQAEAKGDLDNAAKHYLEGGMNYEAIEMYLRRELFDVAMDIAKRTSKEAVQKVMIAQAEHMFYARNFIAMENLLLRAEKPEHAVNLYKRANMWNEAFRVCKDSCPQFMEQLQREFDTSDAKLTVHNDAESIIEQAKRYEKLGEYKRAVECYLQLTPEMMEGNPGALAKCWSRGGELAVKFLKRSQAEYVIQTVAPLLMGIRMHLEAANLYILLGFKELAVETLIAGNLWEEAKDLAGEVSAEMERYVTEQQTKMLKQVGQVDELENLNLAAALDLLCEQGQWKKCLEKAKKQTVNVFNMYLAKYVTHLLKHNQLDDAMAIYAEYGPPADKQHYALYKAISMIIFGNSQYDQLAIWTRLRDILFDVINAMKVTPDATSKYKVGLEKILWCAHYYVNRITFQKVQGMEMLAAKISISLLRYIGTVPAEKAFYEAGKACRDCDWKNMAFIFLNRFMDIYDAIEDGMTSTSELDNTDFLNTDIPLEVELSQQHMVPRQGYDDAREWILAASMDPDIQQALRLDERGVFEASLIPGPNGIPCDQCLLSGYPVLGPRVSFRVNNRAANRDDWNKMVMAVKSTHNQELQNVIEFINDWCGANPNYIF